VSDVVTARDTPHPRDVSVSKFDADTAKNLDVCHKDATLTSLEPMLFPVEDTDEGQFCGDVLSAVQRWFSCSGWPNSVNLITIPDSLRRFIHCDTYFLLQRWASVESYRMLFLLCK